jgi:GNAT superfamily N-acetyltransferase
MSVEKATRADLDAVLGWLEHEYGEDGGEGFWCNRGIIERSFESEDLWVIRRDGEAVAFQVGEYAADIACVRKDQQRQGLGTELFEASLARAIRDDVNVLSGECSPRTSLPFWEKQGFERYGDLSEWGKITVRRVLQRSLDIPQNLPNSNVTVSFYPEAAIYPRDVPSIAVHYVCGARLEDGVVKLERRVIGLMDDEPEGKDLAVKIEVDGELRCFCKAKYDEAEEAGVQRDRMGGAFFVDAIEPRRP